MLTSIDGTESFHARGAPEPSLLELVRPRPERRAGHTASPWRSGRSRGIVILRRRMEFRLQKARFWKRLVLFRLGRFYHGGRSRIRQRHAYAGAALPGPIAERNTGFQLARLSPFRGRR